MPRNRHTPEQIIGKLREAEVGLAGGQTVPEVCRTLEITEQTYYRWRREYGGLKVEQARRFRPHSALGYRPPAPQAIAPRRADPAFAIDGLQPDQPFPITVPGLT